MSFLALFYVGDLGLCSVLPGPDFCPSSSTTVLVHLCISFFGVFFLIESTSALLVLHGQQPCTFFLLLNLAASFGSQFLCYRVALWAEPVASAGSFVASSRSFWVFVHCYHVLCLFWTFLFLFLSGLLRVSSLPLLCSVFGMWLLLRVCALVHCPPLWGPSSVLSILLFSWGRPVLFFEFGVVLLDSDGFPCCFLSYFCTYYLPCVTMLFVCFVPLFQLKGGCLRGVVHSPLAIRLRPSSSLLCQCGCLAWLSSATTPSPLDHCVYGDSSSPGFHIGRCACGDSSSPTHSPIGRCAWGDSCDPPLDSC